MKIFRSIAGLTLLCFIFIGTAFPAQAAALTESQIQEILSLLSSFGADQSVVANVNASLRGGPTTPPPACPTFGRNLTLGSTGGDVSDLQTYLAQNGYFNQTPTGYFGFVTAQAVGQLQLSLGVVSSANDEAYGIFGPRTRTAALQRCGQDNGDAPSTHLSGAVDLTTVTSSLTITSPAPSATTKTVPPGTQVTLEWNSTNADYCGKGLSWSSGSIGTSGSSTFIVPSILGTYHYNINCATNVDGNNHQVSDVAITVANTQS